MDANWSTQRSGATAAVRGRRAGPYAARTQFGVSFDEKGGLRYCLSRWFEAAEQARWQGKLAAENERAAEDLVRGNCCVTKD